MSEPRVTRARTARRLGARPLLLVGLTLAASAEAQAGPVAPEGTQPRGLEGGTLPADAANECFSCHSGGVDDAGQPYRPYDTWAGTMMANAVRDPLFAAALTVAEQDEPGAGAYCLRCHSPQAFVKGNATGVGQALDADDREGVSCEGCHRSVDGSQSLPSVVHDGSTIPGLAALDANAPYIGNARLLWDSRDVRHGPHDDADSPAHAAAQSRFGSSSEFCGQCHELPSPTRTLLDANGSDTGFPFPLDTTYTEWKSSAYAVAGQGFRSCIDCHMPRATGSALTLSTFPSARARATPRTHLLAGANEWSIEAVMKAEPALALERALSFEAAKRATRELLASAVELEIRTEGAVAGSSAVDVTVRVTNSSGHKFPTGYADGRRAFLQVELLDEANRSLALIGRYDAASQTLIEEPGVRVWESVQAEHLADGGHREWHIVKNDVVLKDSRIPPLGFAPAPGRDTRITAAVGADYGSGNAMRNYDDVALRLVASAPLPQGKLRVLARVFFQSTVRAFIDELVAANVSDDSSARLRQIWQDTGYAAPRLIKERTLELEAKPAPVGASAGSDGSCALGGQGRSANSGLVALGCAALLALVRRRRA